MDWRTYVGQHALADFEPLEHEGARMLVRRGYEDSARLLVERKTLPQAEIFVGGGRQAHPVIVLPTGEKAVVKRYHRGGMMRRVNRELYFGGNRAFDELRATERARTAGVQAARVLAAIERPGTVGYRAMLVTLLIPGATDAAAWLHDAAAADRALALREAGRQLAAMHTAGVSHPDVNLRNLLVASGENGAGPSVWVLDFDKARVHPGPVPVGRRVEDLRRIARSARKLRTPVGEEGWRALRDGYGDDWPPRLELR